MMSSAVNRKNHSIFVVAVMIVIVSLILTPLISATYIIKTVYAQESDNGGTAPGNSEEFASRLLENFELSSNETTQTSPAPIPDEETSPTPQIPPHPPVNTDDIASPTPEIPPEPPVEGNDTIAASDNNRTGDSQHPFPDIDYFCAIFFPFFPAEVCRIMWIDSGPTSIPANDTSASEAIEELTRAAENANISISTSDIQVASLADHVLGIAPTIEFTNNAAEVLNDGTIGLTYRLNETSGGESEIHILNTRTDVEGNRYIVFEELSGREVSERIWDPYWICSGIASAVGSGGIVGHTLCTWITADAYDGNTADGRTTGFNVAEPTPSDDPGTSEAIEELTRAAENANISISIDDTMLLSVYDQVTGFAPTSEFLNNVSAVEDGTIGMVYIFDEINRESEILEVNVRTDNRDRYIVFADLNGREVSQAGINDLVASPYNGNATAGPSVPPPFCFSGPWQAAGCIVAAAGLYIGGKLIDKWLD